MSMYPKSKTKNYLLSPDLQRKLEVILSDANPGESSPEEFFSHAGEEFGYVLKGKLEVSIGEEVYILEESDSLFFQVITLIILKVLGIHPAKISG
jgi:quercetin dioxygenase-like cupin family protein